MSFVKKKKKPTYLKNEKRKVIGIVPIEKYHFNV